MNTWVSKWLENNLHKWIDNRTEKWYMGKVIQAVGDVQDDECGFEVKYSDGDGTNCPLVQRAKRRFSFSTWLEDK